MLFHGSFTEQISSFRLVWLQFQVGNSHNMKLITFCILLLSIGSECDRIANYAQVCTTFMQQYYAFFDSTPQRSSVATFYDINDSVLVSAGTLYIGSAQIMDRLGRVSNVVQRNITYSDCQPTYDAGVIVNVFGRISYDVRNASFYSEMFVVKPRISGTVAYYIQNQQYRSAQPTTQPNIADGLRFV